uniref:Uncharacterized protein n=1 Tax=Romanomermis culicivorax TaxID=13658 RepID=A0A915K0K8_ROMCU
MRKNCSREFMGYVRLELAPYPRQVNDTCVRVTVNFAATICIIFLIFSIFNIFNIFSIFNPFLVL